MKNLLVLFALCFSLSLVSCTKKEAAEGEQVEGTTSAATESETPSDEMEAKKDNAPAAAPAADTHEGAKH